MRIRLLPVPIVLLILLVPSPAAAHRDDEFFSRHEGPPGTVVVIHRAYRVVWNGFEAPPGALYHPKRRELTLTEVDRPTRNLEIRIPDVAPGRYALLAYDGSEGGGHITWTVFRVLPGSLPTTGGGFDTTLVRLAAILVAVGLAALSIGVAVSRPRPPSAARSGGSARPRTPSAARA
jgi:hypothetical protein